MIPKNWIPVYLVVLGEIDERIRPFLLNRGNKIKGYIPSTSSFTVTIPLIKKNELKIDITSMTGQAIAIQKAIIGEDIIIGSDFKLKKEYDDVEAFKSMEKGKVAEIKGNVKVMEEKLLSKLEDTIKNLWKRFEKRLKASEKDKTELEKDFDSRIEELRLKYNRIIAGLQRTIDQLQDQLMLQPILFSKKVTNIISSSVIQEINEGSMASSDLTEELAQLEADLFPSQRFNRAVEIAEDKSEDKQEFELEDDDAFIEELEEELDRLKEENKKMEEELKTIKKSGEKVG